MCYTKEGTVQVQGGESCLRGDIIIGDSIMDKTQAVQKIVELLSAEGISPNIDEIQGRVNLLVDKFGVPESETVGSVANYFRNQAGKKIKKSGFAGRTAGSPERKISELTQSGEWSTVNATVVELWESTSKAIDQTGLIGDDTGKIKFTIFNTAGLDSILEEGKSYKFENIVSNEFNGRISVNVNKSSKITPLSEDIEVRDNTVTIEGRITKVKEGSKIIKRCPECNKPLTNAQCPTHSRVEGVSAVRLMAFFDTGDAVMNLIAGTEVVEHILGMSVDQIRKQVVDTLNVGLVKELLEGAVVGRLVSVSGFSPDKTTLVVKDFDVIHHKDAANIISSLRDEMVVA